MFDQQDDISDDDTDEASSSYNRQSADDALRSFREQWQAELRISTHKKQEKLEAKGKNQEKCSKGDNLEENIEEKAKKWYLKGAELERAGIFYEAIQCYKKAVQLVPDIEFKVSQKAKNVKPTESSHSLKAHEEDDQEEEDDPSDTSDDEEIKPGMLHQHIQRKMAKTSRICAPNFEQRSHISSLPTEIILYVFKWMVSSDLDLRSLEVASGVSRGFYLVARDSEIWRLACLKVWGANCASPSSNFYPTWREMFINRPRLNFHGCYISKTTYIRHGENSFQDQFYRPWHLVTYYRYLRFFPEGLVLMLTTPDEPHGSVKLLRNRNARVARGHYRLKDDRVILVVQDTRGVKTNKKQNVNDGEQSFHLEFQILNAGKRKHVQLVWKYYEVSIERANGTVSKSGFDIGNSRFPSLWFSRVKSYANESLFPLV